jgi:hypothetical protein
VTGEADAISKAEMLLRLDVRLHDRAIEDVRRMRSVLAVLQNLKQSKRLTYWTQPQRRAACDALLQQLAAARTKRGRTGVRFYNLVNLTETQFNELVDILDATAIDAEQGSTSPSLALRRSVVAPQARGRKQGAGEDGGASDRSVRASVRGRPRQR